MTLSGCSFIGLDPKQLMNPPRPTGEKAEIHYYLDLEKIAEEEKYDGLYAVCTDLLDDDVADILKVSEGRWQIEDCFRTMKTDFDARPVYCLLYTSRCV